MNGGAMCDALRTPRLARMHLDRMHKVSTPCVFGALQDVPRDPSTVR